MLDETLKTQLRQIFSGLDANYTLEATVGADDENRADFVGLLEDTASCSDKITCNISDGKELQLRILRNGEPLSIAFKAVPNGHEFSSLLLAILNADGKGKNQPDAATEKRVKSLRGEAEVTTYMSLTCTNCPDVVQALNLISIINPSIKHTAIDGALHQDDTQRLHIQAVPTVMLGDELLHVGRSDLGELLDLLENKLGSEQSDDSAPVVHEHDVVVVGGGPAGSAAAIYSARKGLKVAIVAGRIGGQVNETVGIENLISVPYTTGQELAANLRKHAEAYSIDIFDNRRIESFDASGATKELATKSGEIFRAPAVIIATGASWRKLNVPGEDKYIGRGVAFCPHCDGPFYKGKHVAVVGGGNSGIEAAIDLAGICAKVTVIEFLDQLKADTVLQDKLHTLPNVEVFTSKQTTEVVGDGSKVTAIKIKDRVSGEESEIALDGIFVQIGLLPNSTVFRDKVGTNSRGEIITDKDCRTSVAGIYAAGDVTDVTYKQIIIAMGEGAKAALSAFDDKVRGVIK